MSVTKRSLLPLALLLSSTSAFAQSGPWTVTESRGDVVVRTSAGSNDAQRGTQLSAGHQVVTGRNGTATIVRGQEFVTLRPNTRITIAPRQRERGVVQMIQDFGSALFNIGKQPDPHFGVDTPYLAAVVKGTTFSITVTEEGASMQVTEGAVEASTRDGGARDLVRPGEIAMIASDDRFRLNIEGDAARQVDSPQRGVTTPAPTATPVAPTISTSTAKAVSPSGNPSVRNASVVNVAPRPVGSPTVSATTGNG